MDPLLTKLVKRQSEGAQEFPPVAQKGVFNDLNIFIFWVLFPEEPSKVTAEAVAVSQN